MGQAEQIARVRAALEAAERQLGAPGRGEAAGPADRGALRRHLAELKRLVAQLEGGEPAGRDEGAGGAGAPGAP